MISITYRMFLIAVCIIVPGITVHAGDINGNEQSVISAASGTFSYNGKAYQAYPDYIAALREYLLEDDVDLTAGQASSAISQMYASIEQGVIDGYLYPVDGEYTSTEVNKKDASGTDEQENPGGTDSEKEDSETKESFGNSDSEKGEETESGESGENDKVADDTDGSKIQKENYNEAVASLFSDSKDLSKKETKNSVMKMTVILASLVVIAMIAYGVFILLRKRNAAPLIAACLEKGLTEMHCHILPGVDDGSKDMETSMEMVEIGYKNGIRKIVATPHYIENHLKYDENKLQNVFEEFKNEVKKLHPDVTCYLGNELYYYSEQSLNRVKEGKVHTMAGSKYVLIEFSTKISYRDMYKAMKGFVQARYYPVLAHMERFQCLTKHPERVDELAELGVYFQMNADSVLGKGADKVWCRKMLKKNRIQFLGTDAHGTTHRTPEVKKAVSWICEHLEPDIVEDILINNPNMLLENKRID